jgi:hypothetical protein
MSKKRIGAGTVLLAIAWLMMGCGPSTSTIRQETPSAASTATSAAGG